MAGIRAAAIRGRTLVETSATALGHVSLSNSWYGVFAFVRPEWIPLFYGSWRPGGTATRTWSVQREDVWQQMQVAAALSRLTRLRNRSFTGHFAIPSRTRDAARQLDVRWEDF